MEKNLTTTKTTPLAELVLKLDRNHWEAHKLLCPGEYGLGDNLSDKEAFERLGDLWEQSAVLLKELVGRTNR